MEQGHQVVGVGEQAGRELGPAVGVQLAVAAAVRLYLQDQCPGQPDNRLVIKLDWKLPYKLPSSASPFVSIFPPLTSFKVQK